MSNPSIADVYKYAALATASYVRMGDLPVSLRTNGGTFVERANLQSGGRLPTSLGTALFNPADPNAPRWTIVDYYGGDAKEFEGDKSGFAATLFQQGSEKVLAMRGTEPSEDRLFLLPGTGVDLLSADLGQIGLFGLALTQTVSMANYVMRLKTSQGFYAPQLKVQLSVTQPGAGMYSVPVPGVLGSTLYVVFAAESAAPGLGKLQPGETVKLTGHSLGGELAVMAAKLFPEVFDQNPVVFNAAGYDPTTNNWIGPLEGFGTLVGPALPITQALKLAIAQELGTAANFLETTANQLVTTQNVLGTINAALGRSGVTQGAPSVVSLRSESVEPGDDLDIVASAFTGADRYGTPIQVATEANSHVIEPLMDALGLHALMSSMNSSLTISVSSRSRIGE